MTIMYGRPQFRARHSNLTRAYNIGIGIGIGWYRVTEVALVPAEARRILRDNGPLVSVIEIIAMTRFVPNYTVLLTPYVPGNPSSRLSHTISTRADGRCRGLGLKGLWFPKTFHWRQVTLS